MKRSTTVIENKLVRILCVRMSAVGDVVNTLPAIEALRQSFPGAKIGYLVEDRAYGVIEGHPSIDEVFLYPRKRWVAMLSRPLQWKALLQEFIALRKAMRSSHFDISLNFQSNLKGAFFTRLSGARIKVGFSRHSSKENSHLFNDINVSPDGGERINRVEKFVALTTAIGADSTAAAYRLAKRAEREAVVRQWFKDRGLNDYAVIHPGTSDFGAKKRWLPERFAELAIDIHEQTGLISVITWGPGEKELAEGIVAESKGTAILAMQTTHLLDLADITAGAKLYIGCDSGPLHLASAVGTPSVALFGPKDPRTYGPWNPRSRVVQRGQTSDKPHYGEMSAITSADVMAAVRDLLDEVAASAA